MMHSFDPSDIDNWAARQVAKGQLPTLIRRLVQETLPASEPRRIDIPSESSINFPGWDGILEVGHGNSWVPEGVSGWEFSCSKYISRKADENYENRTGEPLGINMETSTFVFVTARVWNDKRTWVRKRCAEGLWQDVRAYDANDLVAWLEQAKEATQWFLSITQNFQGGFQLKDEMESLSTKIQSLESTLISQAKQPDSDFEKDAEYKEATDILDKVSDLVQQGLVYTARTRLKEIEDDAGQLPAPLRFRYLTNIALCDLGEDKVDEAVSLIIEAHEVQPENATGLTNASLAARLQQDYNQAADFAQRALEINPNDPVAAANLMAALWCLGQGDQLEEFISSEKWALGESDSAESLARIRMQQGRHEDAEKIFRSLIEDNPENYRAFVGLSQCLVTRAQENLIPILYSKDLAGILHEAESMASKAVQILRHTQLIARRHEALLLRAYARLRLDNTAEAMHDVDSVLIESPENPDAIRQKGILLLKTGRTNEARNWLEKIQTSDIESDSLLPLADAYLESGDATTAITLLKDSFNLDPPKWEILGRAQSLMQAEFKVGRDDLVGPMLETALGKYPNDPTLIVLSAVRSSLKGDTAAAASALIKAIALSNDSIGRMLRSQLGHLYVGVGQFSDAAEQFGQVCGDDITHPDAFPMLLSLSNSGQYRRALDVARKFHNEMNCPPKEVLNLEAEILGFVGDVKTAALRYRELCSRSDSTPDDLVMLAITQFRCGEYTAAQETIADIDISTFGHNPHSLMNLAHLKRFLGIPNFIEDAYLSRRNEPNDPNIQMNYLALFQSLSEDWEEPSVVEPGCSVRLKADGEEGWWHIVNSTESPQNDRELPPNSKLAQHLLGHGTGDVIELQQGVGKTTCEIVELQSKYVRAFQEIFEEFPLRFPGNPSLSRVKIDNNLTPIFHNLNLRQQYVEKVEKLYESHQIPFVSFCSFIGNSILTTWNEYIKQPDKQFWFGEGTEQEAHENAELLRNASKVTLDAISFLTMHRLQLSDFLKERFSRVSIPQFVFDEIQGEVFQTRVAKAPSGYLSMDQEGNYALTNVSDDAWRSWNEYVSSLLDLAETLDRIPSYPILSIDDHQETIEALKLSGMGAVYLGDEEFETDSVLISDDLALAKIARFYGKRVSNSQALLVELLRTCTITTETYSSKVEELALMNYWFVRVSSGDILQCLEINGYQTTPGIQAMLRTLRGPDCTENTSALVATEIINALARTTILPDQFELLSFSVLREIRSGRHSNSVLYRFRDEILDRLQLHPTKHDHILEIVNALLLTSP
ncbi:MAG: tetratricopeptide repeat protein [Caldilineaceae bacterium]|nr:tetratricopeptide repeat protein [Caldilineaceae bacterium]